MPHLPLKPLPDRPRKALADRWLERLGAELADPAVDRAELCRRTLAEIAYPQYAANWDTAVADPALPAGLRLALAALDPREITLEPEYYAECDQILFQRVKPLLWLAPYIFKRCGQGFKAFQHVEFSFGYNLEVGDNCVVHRHVLLDDRGGIIMGNNVSVSDYANIYSHTHSIVDQRDVTDAVTVLEDNVRITYHATVLAGVRVRCNGMVGALAVATKDVRPYHVYVGIPAKSIRVKPNAPDDAHSVCLPSAQVKG
jgi:acetyltransferase-like isoleucine patch superfamily enzyme